MDEALPPSHAPSRTSKRTSQKNERKKKKRQALAAALAAQQVDSEQEKLREQEIQQDQERQRLLWEERERQAQIEYQKQREAKARIDQAIERKQASALPLVVPAGNASQSAPVVEQDLKTRRMQLLAQVGAKPSVSQKSETCLFFQRTAVCRYGDRCSRQHPPLEEPSAFIVVPNMFTEFGVRDDADDSMLEVTTARASPLWRHSWMKQNNIKSSRTSTTMPFRNSRCLDQFCNCRFVRI
eukprot:GILK01006887.1.p1 GENE.GILK01006887.1~~GILK01006887.1.p1  ORF type:complete len:256 (+),score=27.22 GILK01006887.1:51-770(+)